MPRFSLFGLVFKALVLLAVSFVGIAVFRVLEDRVRQADSGFVAGTGIVLCNLGKVLSVVGAAVLVLWPQIRGILELF
jgi:hypothetical protein